MTGENPLCLCDAFPDPHPHGHIAGGVYCEMLLTGPRISPHLFPATANPAGVPLDDSD